MEDEAKSAISHFHRQGLTPRSLHKEVIDFDELAPRSTAPFNYAVHVELQS